MVSTTPATSPKPWAIAFQQPAPEFATTSLSVVSGTVPPGLRGTLYRNGPGRVSRGTRRVGHWFDGDGAILAVNFSDVGATATYRYVQTAGYQAEAKADQFLFGNYGMTAPGAPWDWFGKPPKNVANTSVIAVTDRLLALWEAGQPHALDLQTLATIGLDDLGGLVGTRGAVLPYSAHPKRDPQTGDIYNFGVVIGKSAVLHLYRSNASGTIRQQAAIALKGVPFIHDFVMAGRYLIILMPPLQINPLPVLANLKSYSDVIDWNPQQGTQILVIDRDSLQVVSRGETEPWFQWHFGNGWVDSDGAVVFDLVRFNDFRTNQYLKEVPTGQIQTPVQGTLWQLRLAPQTATVIDMHCVVDRGCEFPVVSPTEVGQRSRFTYFSLHRPDVDRGQDLFGAIGRFDYETGTLTAADLGANCYPVEPIYAPDAVNPDQGWILTVVLDGDRQTSEVWVYDSDRLDDEPVCRLALPSIIPPGFHGTWKAG